MPVALSSIRSELLPGLFDVRGSYDMIPRQWDKVFTTRNSNMAVERSTQMRFMGLPYLKDEGAATQFDNNAGERFIWTKGEHSLRFGGDYRRFNWDMVGFFQNRGYFQFTQPFTSRTSFNDGTGDPLASFLLGLPALAQRQAGTPSMRLRQNAVDLFVQDDWRLSSSVTVNAGLRYELETPLQDISKILTNLDFIDGKPFAYVGGQNGYPAGLAWADTNNIAPRVGIAWAPGEATSVVRGGYGVFFAYPDMSLWCNQVHNVPLVFPEIRASNALTPTVQGFGFAPPVLGQTLVAFTALDPHASTPMMQQASATFERQLQRNLMVQAGYLGVWGRNFDRSRLDLDGNPLPCEIIRPLSLHFDGRELRRQLHDRPHITGERVLHGFERRWIGHIAD